MRSAREDRGRPRLSHARKRGGKEEKRPSYEFPDVENRPPRLRFRARRPVVAIYLRTITLIEKRVKNAEVLPE